MPDADAEIEPLPVAGGGRGAKTELERLSTILERFNDECARLFDDPERIVRRIREDVAPKVAADPAYQNARANTPQTARLEHERALSQVMIGMLKDDVDLYKQFANNPSFKRAVSEAVLGLIGGGG